MPGLNGTGCARKVLVHGSSRRARRLGLVPGGHAQQVADAHRLEVVARLGRGVVGEELEHLVVDAELPLRDGQADGGGGEALAQRVQRVRRLGVVGRPPALGHDVAVAHEHEAVHRRRSSCRPPRRTPARPADETPCASGTAPRQVTGNGQRAAQCGQCDDDKDFHGRHLGPGEWRWIMTRSIDFAEGPIFSDPSANRNRGVPGASCPARPPPPDVAPIRLVGGTVTDQGAGGGSYPSVGRLGRRLVVGLPGALDRLLSHVIDERLGEEVRCGADVASLLELLRRRVRYRQRARKTAKLVRSTRSSGKCSR